MKMKSTITMFAGAAFFALPAFSQITQDIATSQKQPMELKTTIALSLFLP
jgi:hypothetical protein